MLTFKTQFPINEKCGTKELIEAGRIWLAGSPHSSLSEIMTNAKDIKDGWSRSTRSESIVFANHVNGVNVCGFRYENSDENEMRWVTEVVGTKYTNKFLLSVQLDVGSELPVEKIDHGKRPHFLKTVMNEIGGGMDGKLRVADKPHYLKDKDIGLAADLINSHAGCLMPIVYVSADDDGTTHINPIMLSQWLSGMAHVVVEPNRDFSFGLMGEVSNENAYGGAVAIYWPDGIGKWLFMPKYEYSDPKSMQVAIARKVRQSLLSQRAKRECTWGYIQELKSKERIEYLKQSGSAEIDDFVAAFDDEIASKNEEINRLEQEISRLKYGNYSSASEVTTELKALSLTSTEVDRYQGERLEIVVDAIINSIDGTQPHSRRRHILEDLRDSNIQTGERDTILEHLKELLRSYKSMNSSTRKELERMGFKVTEEGKHYKLEFRNDKRYHFSLAKTGSDHRGGLNAFSEIKNKLF